MLQKGSSLWNDKQHLTLVERPFRSCVAGAGRGGRKAIRGKRACRLGSRSFPGHLGCRDKPEPGTRRSATRLCSSRGVQNTRRQCPRASPSFSFYREAPDLGTLSLPHPAWLPVTLLLLQKKTQLLFQTPFGSTEHIRRSGVFLTVHV